MISKIELKSYISVKRVSVHIDHYDGDIAIGYSEGGDLIFMHEDEQRHLLRILIGRFPLDALGHAT